MALQLQNIRYFIKNISPEENVSQIFHIGLSFDFIKSRKIIMKKYLKSSPFFDKNECY